MGKLGLEAFFISPWVPQRYITTLLTLGICSKSLKSLIAYPSLYSTYHITGHVFPQQSGILNFGFYLIEDGKTQANFITNRNNW